MSPEEIGRRYGRTGRSVRTWMQSAGIARAGASHLRKGKSASWNIGLVRTEASKVAARKSNTGRTPWNFEAGHAVFTCEFCGKTCWEQKSRRKRYCNQACKVSHMALLRGEQHWNYKGQYARKEQTQRHWADYRSWRSAVLKRDHATCQKCQGNDRLTAHHKNNWHSFPEQRFDVSNGISLCWQCHWAFHRTYGHKFCTVAMLDEWLTKTK